MKHAEHGDPTHRTGCRGMLVLAGAEIRKIEETAGSTGEVSGGIGAPDESYDRTMV
jgi:hypothetical protein